MKKMKSFSAGQKVNCRKAAREAALERVPAENTSTPAALGGIPTDRLRGPRENPAERFSWGEEEQAERRALSPKAEAHAAPLVLTRDGGQQR